MVRPLSMDLRERIMRRRDAGETTRAIAAALDVSPSAVSKLAKRQRETGSLAHGKIGGHVVPVLSGAVAEWLAGRVRSAPFTLRGLVAELAERGTKTSLTAVFAFVHGLELSFKKNSAADRAVAPGHRPKAQAVDQRVQER